MYQIIVSCIHSKQPKDRVYPPALSFITDDSIMLILVNLPRNFCVQ